MADRLTLIEVEIPTIDEIRARSDLAMNPGEFREEAIDAWRASAEDVPTLLRFVKLCEERLGHYGEEVEALRSERDVYRDRVRDLCDAENADDEIGLDGGARSWAIQTRNLADASATLARRGRPEGSGR